MESTLKFLRNDYLKSTDYRKKTWNSVFNTHIAPDTLDYHIFIDHKRISKCAQYDSVFWIIYSNGGKGVSVGEGMSWLGEFMKLGHTCQLYNVIIGAASLEL